jgi:hypothetical protein
MTASPWTSGQPDDVHYNAAAMVKVTLASLDCPPEYRNPFWSLTTLALFRSAARVVAWEARLLCYRTSVRLEVCRAERAPRRGLRLDERLRVRRAQGRARNACRRAVRARARRRRVPGAGRSERAAAWRLAVPAWYGVLRGRGQAASLRPLGTAKFSCRALMACRLARHGRAGPRRSGDRGSIATGPAGRCASRFRLCGLSPSRAPPAPCLRSRSSPWPCIRARYGRRPRPARGQAHHPLPPPRRRRRGGASSDSRSRRARAA